MSVILSHWICVRMTESLNLYNMACGFSVNTRDKSPDGVERTYILDIQHTVAFGHSVLYQKPNSSLQESFEALHDVRAASVASFEYTVHTKACAGRE